MKGNKKKEVRQILTTRIKPSIKKKASKKAEDNGTNISRIVEAKLEEYIQ
jgi:predicted HicB family RNase H-like nuclease